MLTPKSMQKNLLEVKDMLFDLLIVGGGIVGAGVARDASLRGLSVVLVEQRDLSSGTSSRSSRLIHGGIRYLDTHDFSLVYKDLREREKLLHIAPHLVHPLRFIVPSYGRTPYGRLRLRVGMVLYDLLSMGKTLPSHKMLSKDEILQMEPSLLKEGLQGGALFYDCQAALVERLCIENAISASENGAAVLTHSRVTKVEQDSSRKVNVTTVEKSGKKYELQSRAVVNAAGPWADELDNQKDERLRLTKGVHVVVPKINDVAIVLYALSDQRLFFVVPWLGYTLIGTTDTDFSGNPGESIASDRDIQYLMRESSQFVPEIASQPVLFSYSGVRPLVRETNKKAESTVSRNYKIVDDSKTPSTVLVSVMGVKITSYRIASKEAVDLVSKKLGRFVQSTSGKIPLPGGKNIGNFTEFQNNYIPKLSRVGLDVTQTQYLLNIYGSRIEKLLELLSSDPKLAERFCPNNPDIAAEIVLAVNEEFAENVSDFLLRRSAIGFSECHGLDCAGNVAQIMGGLLGWDGTKIGSEIEDYRSSLSGQLVITPEPKTSIS